MFDKGGGILKDIRNTLTQLKRKLKDLEQQIELAQY